MNIRSISQATGKELLEQIKKDRININTVDTGRLFKLCRTCAETLAKTVRLQPTNTYATDKYYYSFLTELGIQYYLIYDIVVYNYNGTVIGGLGTIYYSGTDYNSAQRAGY